GINYYITERSADGIRLTYLQGKRGWLTQLLEPDKADVGHEIDNPAAALEMSPEEILVYVSDDPEKTRARVQAVKVEAEKQARAKIARVASATLRGAAARFEAARHARDPQDAARLRSEAEQRLAELQRIDPGKWPWATVVLAARDHRVLVPVD